MVLLLRLVGRRDPRNLISRPHLYELLSEIGFIRVYAVFNDFVFAPLTRPLIWLLRNASILLENAPLVRSMAGSILVHAQKPPRQKKAPQVSLFAHESLRGAVSVVIPCHNEEMNVGPLVERILELYGDYIYEIIPVNDGSTDSTAEVLSQLAQADARVKPLHRQPPNGVGLAISEGLAAATGNYVLTMDCDFQHLLPEFRELFDGAAAGFDVVIGSRFSRHSVLLNYPFAKIFANRAFHVLAVLLFGRRIRDVTNNLKIMRREVVADLQLRQPGFAVNAETGLQPLLMGYKVEQVPISWINRTPGMGTSSFRLMRVGGGYWGVLAGLWLKHAFGIGPYRGLVRHDRGSKKARDRCHARQRNRTMSGRQTRWLLLALFAVTAVLQIAIAGRQCLWADEIFSLAIATGHSLEHPAAAAQPQLGDFVEPDHAVCRRRSCAATSSMTRSSQPALLVLSERYYFRTPIPLFITFCYTDGRSFSERVMSPFGCSRWHVRWPAFRFLLALRNASAVGAR